MSAAHLDDLRIRPWADADLPLLERLLGDPAMTRFIGGPETREKLRERHERYRRSSEAGESGAFVIEVGPGRGGAGWVGDWESAWQGEPIWEVGWSVLPEFQGHGLATRATVLVVERARAERKHRFMHAFPSVLNAQSNAICRKVGFSLLGEGDFEYPKGSLMRCNDWRLDLFSDAPPVTAHRPQAPDVGASGSLTGM